MTIANKILLTIAYTEQFDYPLTAREIYSRILTNFYISPDDFIQSLKYLHFKKHIVYSDSFFFISGLRDKKMQKLIQTRKSRTVTAQKKWLEVTEFTSFASKVPFITGVCVTGSLAMDNTVPDDDIDFMIVTRANRLWIARLLVIFYASMKNKRRSFASEEKNSWCFNLWVEESDLQLPPKSRSVYEAYEVVQTKWILSKNNVEQNFHKLNSWTRNFLFMQGISRSSLPSTLSLNHTSSLNTFFEFPLITHIMWIVNFISFQLQFLYMKRHMTREKVSKTHAFFHPRDTKNDIFNKWKQTVRRLV